LSDVITSVSSAIALLGRLRTVAGTIRDAEFKNLLADLNIEMADVKMKLAEVVDENLSLKRRIAELESTDAEPCPKCRKRTWELVSSRPARHLGALGVIERTYKCSACEFSEAKTIT
jgi:hypothetical protein